MPQRKLQPHTHTNFITLYKSELHGIITTLVLLTIIATTQHKTLHNRTFTTDNKSAFDQVFHVELVKSVYGFSQDNYDLIIIV